MFINKEHEEAYKLMQSLQYDKAVVLYSKCIKQFPDAPDLYSERGVAFIHLKEKEKSLSDLNKSAELQPDYAYRYASRGHAKDFFGDLDGAIEDYEMAAELDPNDAIVYNNLGLLLEKKGNTMMANDYYRRSDELRKQEESLHNVVSQIENENSDFSTIEGNSLIGEPEIVNTKTRKSEIKKIFTQKSQWKEFLQFIKNGFKLK